MTQDITALYQQAIREHSRNPGYRYRMDRATRSRRMDNAACGDWVELSVLVQDGVIREAAFAGEGCALAIASADICCKSLIGLSEADALTLAQDVLAALDEEEAALRIVDTTAAPLLAARSFPARLGCVRLAWEGMKNLADEKFDGIL